jgi:hypothetical protein
MIVNAAPNGDGHGLPGRESNWPRWKVRHPSRRGRRPRSPFPAAALRAGRARRLMPWTCTSTTVREDDCARLAARVRAMQARSPPRRAARSSAAPTAKEGLQTWMEVYPAVDDAKAARLEQACAQAGLGGMIDGPRPRIFYGCSTMCLIVFAWRVIPAHAADRGGQPRRVLRPPGRTGGPVAGKPASSPAATSGAAAAGWASPANDADGAVRFAALTNIRSPNEARRRADARRAGGRLPEGRDRRRRRLHRRHRAGRARLQRLQPAAGRPRHAVLVLEPRRLRPAQRQAAEAGDLRPLERPARRAVAEVVRTKAQFASLLCQGAPEDAYFEMLADTTRAPDVRLPDTGVTIDLERCCRRCASRVRITARARRRSCGSIRTGRRYCGSRYCGDLMRRWWDTPGRKRPAFPPYECRFGASIA